MENRRNQEPEGSLRTEPGDSNHSFVSMEERNRTILHTSIMGIVVNVVLATLKAVIGIISNSVAITLDSVNNLTDAGSSVITIVGTKLAARKPDKKHPWGHGRLEYLSAMLLGTLVLSAGISSLTEAVRKILDPETPQYTARSLIIIAICVLAKIILGKYVVSMGKRVNSEALINSGKDASMDAVVSLSTIAAALIFIFTGVSTEAWIGAGISALIIKTGLEMLYSTISEIMGERADPEIVREVRETVESFPEVHGVYDIILQDHGPFRMSGSLHIEVDDTVRAYEISNLTRRITMKVLQENHVYLTAVSIYPKNTDNETALKLRQEITDIALRHDHILQVHGFYQKDNVVQFDLIIDFDTRDPLKLCDEVTREIRDRYPELEVEVFCDTDYSFSE